MAINQIRGNLLVSELKSRISSLQIEINAIDADIAQKNTELVALESDNPAILQKRAEIDLLQQEKANKLAQVSDLNTQLIENSSTNNQSAIIATRASSSSAKVASSAVNDATAPKVTLPKTSLEYNVPSVLDAYYSTRASFLNAAGFSSNRPGRVASANELWSGSKSSKGMIVAYTPPATAVEYQGNQTPPSSVSTAGTKYGFQFMYNPATISMDYSGFPNVDQGFEISGQDKFVLYGTSVTQSTISFQLLINRMFDMKYYDSYGRLKPGAQKAYAGKVPSVTAQRQIFNMGTMYDIEYLLRTLLGYTLKSYLRQNQTADMGYLGARPVELHLGKSLRYLGTVTTLKIEHVIFNEQMVPLFTNVSVGFARLPDYPLVEESVATPTKTQGETGGGGGFSEIRGAYDMGDLGVGGGLLNDYIN
jgi:hypothetical protein